LRQHLALHGRPFLSTPHLGHDAYTLNKERYFNSRWKVDFSIKASLEAKRPRIEQFPFVAYDRNKVKSELQKRLETLSGIYNILRKEEDTNPFDSCSHSKSICHHPLQKTTL
jgi:hypothetical protein